ncbi:MAG TPA: ATP synthase F1 subunit delta [Candidatus Krumholzibacteria bacterium]|nr:ATP synthase F1 subunit delta [Candidatus Krumholzibacteria bacterium]
MASTGVGRRYAIALFNAAKAEDVLDQVHGDVTSFGKLLHVETGLRNFLLSLRVSGEEKRELVMKALGDRASGLFVKFLLLLIDKKRTANFDEIARAFVSLYEEHQGVVEVRVVTAIPLDAELERKAKDVVERRTGKKVKLEKRVEPRIIGGMIMFIENQVYDGSITNRLGDLGTALHATRVH